MATIISLPASANRSVIPAVPQAAYLHIPFCRRRCYYCDFAIAVTGEFTPVRRNKAGIPDPTAPKTPIDGSNSGRISDYVETLIQEIERSAPGERTTRPPLKTIFFGGGTPSLLSVDQFGRILEVLTERFTIAPDAEISMEMDPGTFERAKLEGFLGIGLNRVSLGVQAFQDDLLAACGRLHREADVDRAITMLQECQVTNWSLDLITGLSHQSWDHWRQSLQRAIAAQPTHLSIYDLTVEPGTVFEKRYEPGEFPLPTEAIAADFYRYAHDVLTAAGYNHYEISNYAKPGYSSRHNLVYWHNQPYYGFGMAATSYVDGQRFSRPRTTHAYQGWVNAGMVIDAEPVGLVDQWLETLMVGLRLSTGLPLAPLIAQFGQTTVQELLRLLKPYCEQGLVVVTASDESEPGAIALQCPEGFLVSNDILSTLFQRWMDSDHLYGHFEN